MLATIQYNNDHFTKDFNKFSAMGLNPNERCTLSLVYNRMASSNSDNRFFDRRRNQFFVLFTRQEMADDLNISTKTVTRTVKSLVDKGLLVRPSKEMGDKIKFNSGLKLFTPYLRFDDDIPKKPISHVGTNSPYPRTNCPSNNKTSNKTTHYVRNTVNTSNGRKAPEKKSFRKSNPLSDWVDSVNSKRAGLTLGASQCIARFCSYNFKYNPVKHCKHIYNIIVVARNYVVKHANKKIPKELTRFESNTDIRSGLESKLRKVFSKVMKSTSKKLTLNHYAKYLMTTLENFFHSALGLDEQKVASPENQVINDNGRHKRKPIKEGLPDWEKHKKDPNKLPKTSKALQRTIQARLKRLGED